jgi:glutathione S-transferase
MYMLYHFPFSPYVRRVVALMEEAGLPYELKPVDLPTGEHMSAEFRAVNPNHQAPVLVDDGLQPAQSNAILRYLCAKHGLSEWYPADPKPRALVDQWLDWNRCRLGLAVADIVLNKVFLGEHGGRRLSGGSNAWRMWRQSWSRGLPSRLLLRAKRRPSRISRSPRTSRSSSSPALLRGRLPSRHGWKR